MDGCRRRRDRRGPVGAPLGLHRNGSGHDCRPCPSSGERRCVVTLGEVTKEAGDLAAGGFAVGTLIGYLPSVAALFTILWTGIRIWEWYRGKRETSG